MYHYPSNSERGGKERHREAQRLSWTCGPSVALVSGLLALWFYGGIEQLLRGKALPALASCRGPFLPF